MQQVMFTLSIIFVYKLTLKAKCSCSRWEGDLFFFCFFFDLTVAVDEK